MVLYMRLFGIVCQLISRYGHCRVREPVNGYLIGYIHNGIIIIRCIKTKLAAMISYQKNRTGLCSVSEESSWKIWNDGLLFIMYV